MLPKVTFCTACLAMRGLAPAACFSIPPRDGLSSRRWGCGESGGVLRRYAAGGAHGEASSAAALFVAELEESAAKRLESEEGRPVDDHLYATHVPAQRSGCVDLTVAERAGGREASLEGAATAACTIVLTGTLSILACLLIEVSLLVVGPPDAHATDAAAATQKISWLVAPSSTGRAHPPPPEIPPGRITIMQWCERNIGPYLSRLDVQTATQTLEEQIRTMGSGHAPSVGDLRRVVGKVARVKNELDESVATVWPRRVREEGFGLPLAKSSSTTSSSLDVPAGVPQEEGHTGFLIHLLPAASTSTPEAGAPAEPPIPGSPDPAAQEQMDAVKAELLQLQNTPPQQSGGPSETLSSPPISPVRPQLRRFSFTLKGSRDDKTTSAPTDSIEPAPALGARERRLSVKGKKRWGQEPFAVDLKAELRAESERTAAAASRRTSQIENAPQTPAGRRSGGVEVEPPAALHSSPAESAPSSESVFSVEAFTSRGGSGSSLQGADSSSEPMSSQDVTAASRASQERSNLGGLSERMQDAADQARETVRDLTDKGSRASDAGVEAVLVQGRARLDQLQAEANRISARLRESAAEPLAQELSAVVTRLPETSQRTGDRPIELSRSAATAASDAVKHAVAGTDGLRVATNGRLSEALGRGVDKLALSAGEIEKVVIGGVSSVSKSAAASVPAVQDRISLFSSQVAGNSVRAATRASEAISAEAGQLSSRLSDLSDRGVDISNRARSVLDDGASAAIRSLKTTSREITGNYISEGQSKGMIYATAALAVIGAAATVTGVRTGSRAEVGAGGPERGEGNERSKDEGKALQPIGASLEVALMDANEGEPYGVEAMAATGMLWDIIKQSGTGAGDAVREVSEEDLLARACRVGRKLRETAEGLKVLKEEVLSLRRSIRESDLEGKARAFQENLASALEGRLNE